MVTIIDFAVRTWSDGSQFYCLILQGRIELVKSKQTERFYATVIKASIPLTFDKAILKASIGQQFPRSIQKQSCDPSIFTVKDIGEVLELTCRKVPLLRKQSSMVDLSNKKQVPEPNLNVLYFSGRL